jgi:PAS domain S-box-containing protein
MWLDRRRSPTVVNCPVKHLFAKQLAEATRPDGEVDIALLGTLVSAAYEEVDHDRRRANDATALMIDEIDRSNKRLLDAFEVVPEGLVLLDAQNRFVLWNRRYAENYPGGRENLVVGGSFEAGLRNGIAYNPEAIGREEEWISERLAQLAQSSNSHEQLQINGRWVRVEERRTTDGGSIGIRIDITELKRREASFRLLFQSNPIPMWVVERNSLRFLDVNAAAVTHYGYSHAQFMAMTLLDIRPTEDWDDLRATVAHGADNAIGRVRRHVKANGTKIEAAIFTQSLNFGGSDALLGAAIDVTARRRAEDELRSTKAFLDTVIENIPAMIVVREADDQKRFVLINRAFETFFGHERKNIIGKTIHEALPQASIDRIEGQDQQLLAAGSLFVDEHEISTPGGPRYAVSKRIVVKEEDGKQRYLLTVMDDVTERRMAKQQLLEANEMLQAIINSSPVAIVGSGPSGCVLIWNETAEEMFGYSAAEAIGRRVADLIVPTDRLESFDSLHSCGLSGQSFRNVIERRKRKDGTILDVQIAAAPVFAADGSTRATLVAYEDITKRKLLEDQLRQSQKMEAIGQLTGGLSHDFNNLLAVIIGNLDLLREHVGWNPDAGEILDEALHASLQGADLNKRLLAFARRQPLQPRQIDLNELVANTVKLLVRTLGADIEIKFSPATGLWPLLVDPTQLESALTNLAVNARDAMPGGGRLIIGTRNVAIDRDYADTHSDVSAGDFVLLEVSDSGSGMTPEVMAHVFEPFFTTKDKEKGTGLGLSMVFGFAKQSGGHIGLYSEVGIGTTFRLYLPRAAMQVVEPTPPPADSVARGHETILAVEDNENLRKLLVKQLTDLGYRVLQAEHAQGAIEILKGDETIDLLFTDIIMPGGMNGNELAREALVLRRGLKVVFTSGFPDAAFRSDGALPSDAILLGKPYRRDELARCLRRAMAASVEPAGVGAE